MQILSFSERYEGFLRPLGLENIFSAAMRRRLQIRKYAKGEHLTEAGVRPCGIQIILSGRVRVTPLSSDGRGFLLTRLEPPAMLGDIESLSDLPFLYTAEAASPVTSLYIPPEYLDEALQKDVAFLRFMLFSLCEKLLANSEHFSNAKLYGARSRLCAHLCELQGRGDAGRIPFSTRETAALLNVSERHLRRILAQLQGEGLIEKYPRELRILDSEALRREAGTTA